MAPLASPRTASRSAVAGEMTGIDQITSNWLVGAVISSVSTAELLSTGCCELNSMSSFNPNSLANIDGALEILDRIADRARMPTPARPSRRSRERHRSFARFINILNSRLGHRRWRIASQVRRPARQLECRSIDRGRAPVPLMPASVVTAKSVRRSSTWHRNRLWREYRACCSGGVVIVHIQGQPSGIFLAARASFSVCGSGASKRWFGPRRPLVPRP